VDFIKNPLKSIYYLCLTLLQEVPFNSCLYITACLSKSDRLLVNTMITNLVGMFTQLATGSERNEGRRETINAMGSPTCPRVGSTYRVTAPCCAPLVDSLESDSIEVKDLPVAQRYTK
jgi:hypothetical protein